MVQMVAVSLALFIFDEIMRQSVQCQWRTKDYVTLLQN